MTEFDSSDLDKLTKSVESLIDDNDVVLFVKGTREVPLCGFSAKVISILDSIGVQFEVVDVMQGPGFREAVKIYSDWPTFPQLYIKGELIGGCDIVSEMHDNGELLEHFRVYGIDCIDVTGTA